MDSPSAAFKRILEVLDRLEIPYFVTGSVAGSIYGIARTTLDLDLVADLQEDHIPQLVSELQADFYADPEIEALVDAVGCHARALVLLAGEVRDSGVRRATENLHQLMAALEKKHPGERERSLLASVQLSLRRLPAATREKFRPLGVFQGGGWDQCIGIALGLDIQKDEEIALARELVGVGLAEQLAFGYLRFDPALAPALLDELSAEEREAARAAWAEAMAAEIGFLYQQQSKDANLASNLCLLDLANLLAAVERSAKTETPERVVNLATRLEALIANLNRPNALARAVAIRAAATQHLGGWGHAQFVAERAAIERLREEGEYAEAVGSAASLLQKTEQAGDAAYPEAASDRAVAQLTLGRSLRFSGAAADAVPYLDEARRGFEALGENGMANTALTPKADCLTDLGRYDEAAAAYEEAIAADEQQVDQRGVAVGKNQLATVRVRQRRYADALKLYYEVLGIFRALGEAASVGIAWHQIGMVQQKAGDPDAAERAYQESLKISVQTGDDLGESQTLGQLGNLYSQLDRREDAVRCYRQAADVHVRLRDLRHEGLDRSNLALQLIALNRYDEARAELERAIECKRPFGHVAEPWKTFAILSNLERAAGNEPAAQKARAQAIDAYLAYRRDGGAPPYSLGERIACDPAGVLVVLKQAPELPPRLRGLIPALQAILAGSRDTAFADDPNLHYADAAELLLLIER